MSGRAALAVCALTLAIPSAAAAQSPPQPAPQAPPAPPAPPATIALVGDRVFRDGRVTYALAGRSFVVRGQLRPAPPGEQIVVRIYRGKRKLRGNASVPPHAASHGCLRVPIPDARAIYGWLRLGDVVWVEP